MIINKSSIRNFRKITDVVLLNCAFLAAAVFAQSFDLLIERNYMFSLLLIENIIWLSLSSPLKIYDDFYSRRFSAHIIVIFKSVFILLLAGVLFIFIVKEDLFTRNFILYNSGLLFLLIIVKEILFRTSLKSYRQKGSNLRKLVIIGAGELGQEFKNFLLANPGFGYSFLGFIDDENEDQTVLGKINEFESIISKSKVEDIVIALPLSQYSHIDKLLKICDKNAVKTYIVPDYFQFLSNKFKINLFGNFPVITVRNNPLEEAQWRLLKRIVDLVVSGTLLFLILWWLLPLIGILIKLFSKGPALFVQERVGLNNSIFKCYKFRTMSMVASSDKNSTRPVTEDDERITGIGKFLRKTNLDELPQFLNVLKGEMSLVGPRPHAIPFENSYGEIVDEIRLRHRVLPGITGWAQIHGLRGDVFDFDEKIIRTRKRIEYDIWYIENWSFGLDLQIIFETFWQVFTGTNKGN